MKAFLLKNLNYTMLAKKVLTAVFLITATFSFAQNYSVKGKVVNKQNIPEEFALVSILEQETFEVIIEDYTDDKGEFSLDVSKGSYLIYIESFLGASHEREITIDKNTRLETIVLDDGEVIALEGAVITGTSQVYRMDLDKKVYDMSSDPMAKGSSLSDALDNVPSVQVDGEGNVSLRGNENVRILIDGKPSSLIGITDPAQALQSLPADIVDRVEVITNPSARYEAEGSAGIINIILKKGKLRGLNGSVNLNGGTPLTAGASASLNYRTEKWNHFTNFGYRYSEWENRRSSFTTRYDSDGIPRYEDMDGKGTWTRKGFNAMLGTEYFLDDKNTFTLSGNMRKGKNFNESNIHYYDYDADMNETAASLRTQEEDAENFSVEGNFNFKHEFNRDGHELTVDARATYSERKEDGFFYETGEFINSTENALNDQYRNNVILSTDYVYPFENKGRFEFGLRSEFSGNLTDFKVDSLAGNDWVSVPEYSNRTDYLQNIYAAYAQYGRAFGDFSFFAGMRMENSDITVKSILNDSKINKNYVDFFPSLFLNYEFHDDAQLQVSYSRRVRRPRGWDLIPYTSYANNRNMRVGNPELNPQYTDSYEMSYVMKIGKLMLTPNVYYSHTKDNIQRYQSINEHGVIVSSPINIGTDDRYGGDLTMVYRPFRWWNLMGNVNLFGYKTRGEYTDSYVNANDEEITRTTSFDGDGFSWFGRLSSTFTLPQKINLQVSGMYRGGSKTAQSERKPMYGVDLSLSKDIFNDNATITASVRDLFDTRAFRMTSFGDDFHIDSKFRWSVRSVNLTFTYRFNQSKRDERRQQRKMENGEDFEMEGGGM